MPCVANSTVRFMIEFKPRLVQIYQCCLSIRTAKTRVQVPLRGKGVCPVLKIEPEVRAGPSRARYDRMGSSTWAQWFTARRPRTDAAVGLSPCHAGLHHEPVGGQEREPLRAGVQTGDACHMVLGPVADRAPVKDCDLWRSWTSPLHFQPSDRNSGGGSARAPMRTVVVTEANSSLNATS